MIAQSGNNQRPTRTSMSGDIIARPNHEEGRARDWRHHREESMDGWNTTLVKCRSMQFEPAVTFTLLRHRFPSAWEGASWRCSAFWIHAKRKENQFVEGPVPLCSRQGAPPQNQQAR